jgi:Protein of unknown function (DUF4232)
LPYQLSKVAVLTLGSAGLMALSAPAWAAPAGTSAQTSPATAAAPCTGPDVTADLFAQPQVWIDGATSKMLVVTNRSGRDCELYGSPTIVLRNGAGEPMSDARTVQVDHPGPAVPIVLQPGAAAFAGVKFTYCGRGELVGGIGMELPGDTSSTNVRTDVAIQYVCDGVVTAGTFQPSRQGVIFTS